MYVTGDIGFDENDNIEHPEVDISKSRDILPSGHGPEPADISLATPSEPEDVSALEPMDVDEVLQRPAKGKTSGDVYGKPKLDVTLRKSIT